MNKGLPVEQASFDQVRQRFADFSNVHVIKGEVPKSFEQSAPEKISFLHIDMHDPAAEVGAIEQLYDRVELGTAIIFNDYGWRAHREQKLAEDRFFEGIGQQILEIPTGQGLLIK